MKIERMANMSVEKSCEKLCNNINNAIEWVNSKPSAIKDNELKKITRDLELNKADAEKLLEVASKPMSAGVYGPSQVGKSYMISVLCKPENQAGLFTVMGNQEINFLTELNPSGDKESTGIVTRFTILKPKDSNPEGYPVTLRLLSFQDLVMILIDTYFNDSGHQDCQPLTNDIVVQALKAVQNNVVGDGFSKDGYTEVDAYRLSMHVKSKYQGYRNIGTLDECSFWAQFEELAPRLGIEDQVKLLELLWGKVEAFSNLFLRLYSVLKDAEFSSVVYAKINSLMPRDNSVIDVATLLKFLESDDESEAIEVRTLKNKGLAIGLGELSALISELVIYCKDRTWDFQETTDVLDFPGARSRYGASIQDAQFAIDSEPTKLAEFFLRGKVSYLAEKYYENYEFNHLILTVKSGNQEVRTLPTTVENWIRKTQGATPEERAKNRVCSLFFVLLQFDTIFYNKSGDTDKYSRIPKAMKSTLLDYFGGGDRPLKWVENWIPGQHFNNCFFFRNPKYEAEALIEYSGELGRENRRECGHVDKSELEQLKERFLNDDDTNRLFSNAERAWDEVLKLNDGGRTYIAEELEKSCDIEVKNTQIMNRLDNIAQHVLAVLKQYYISGDKQQQYTERSKQFSAIVLDLWKGVVGSKNFGHFLRVFQTTAEQMNGRLTDMPIDDWARQADSKVEEEFGQRVLEIFEGGSSADPAENETESVRSDTEYLLAKASVLAWQDEVHRRISTDDLDLEFNVPKEKLLEIYRELEKTASINSLVDRIAEKLENRIANLDDRRKPLYTVSIIVSDIINSFVFSVGQSLLPRDKRGTTKDDKKLFDVKEQVDEITEIKTIKGAVYNDFVDQWLLALNEAIKNNIFEGEQDYNADENNQLKAIIESFSVV